MNRTVVSHIVACLALPLGGDSWQYQLRAGSVVSNVWVCSEAKGCV